MTQFKNYHSILCLDLFFIYGRFIPLGSNTIFLFNTNVSSVTVSSVKLTKWQSFHLYEG